MTVKEYLNQYLVLCEKIRQLETEYQKACEKIDSIRSPASNDGMPHGTDISRSVENLAIELEEYKRKLKMAIKAAEETRQNVVFFIQSVDDELELKVLYGRYVDGLTWPALADRLRYSERHIERVHGIALYKLRKKFNMS